ncbi:MAG: hypothetical protein LC751_07705 [Actinobacteria bacterium]|nr:hypothetical protein [Actinomycetota bacterium]
MTPPAVPIRQLEFDQACRRCGIADEECLGLDRVYDPYAGTGVVRLRDVHGPPDVLGPNRHPEMGGIVAYLNQNFDHAPASFTSR